MVVKCISCRQTFSSTAALNFHKKKIHGTTDSSSAKIDKGPSNKKSAIRMLEFGDVKEGKKELFDPFRIGTVEVKVNPKTNEEEVFITLEPKDTKPTPVSKEQSTVNKNLKRKSASSDSEDSDCDDIESPVKNRAGSPSMPKLVPQVDMVPNTNPKKIKQWKCTQDEDDKFPESISISRPTTSSVKNLTVSDDLSSIGPRPGRSHHGSVHTDSITDKLQKLPTTPEKKPMRKVRQFSGSSSSQYSGNSDDNKSTTSSAVKSVAGQRKGSAICQVCGQTGFKTPNQFTNHLEIHEGKRPYLCPMCGMGYETDLKLLEHVSIRHSQEALFKCNDCSQAYKTKRGLENHRCNGPNLEQ